MSTETEQIRAQDPRRGMTSASSAAADALCPGRHQAQRGLPERNSAEASLGTLMHKAYSGDAEAMAALADADRRVVNRATEIDEVIVKAWSEGKGAVTHAKNVRIWSNDIHSGEVDAIWLSEDGKHALIGDLKSQPGDQQDATENAQLRDYAALAFDNHCLKTCTVFINQPRVSWKVEDVTVVRYEREELERAYDEMIERVAASNAPNAKRVPGELQCKYCRAAGTNRCPESVTKMFATTKSVARGPVWERLSPAERGCLISDLMQAEDTAKKMLAEAKARIKDDPDCVDGWVVSPDQTPRKVADVMGVANKLAETFPAFDPVKFAAACNISVGELEKVHKALDTEGATKFAALFDGFITTTTRAGSLQKTK